MGDKVFISYSHEDGEWVTDRLEPVLTAAGVEVLIDVERFRAGHALIGEMDATQDLADRSILVFSPSYLKSDYCRHEMERAIARDPAFTDGRTLPLMRVKVRLPDPLSTSNPLYADLKDDSAPRPWSLLLDGCGGSLGATAPAWLHARDEIRRYLKRGQSVNLLVRGEPSWHELLHHLSSNDFPDLVEVNLSAGRTTTRRALVETILESCGSPSAVPHDEDLVVLDRVLSARSQTRLAFLYFDLAPHRDPSKIDLFASLRDLIMTKRKLVAVFQSRRPFADLLPREHPLSHVDVKTVELAGPP